MVDVAKLKVGDKVYYQPSYYPTNKYDNGIVKSIPEESTDSVRVVFHCGGDWDNYKDYTGQLTNVRDLKKGWKH